MGERGCAPGATGGLCEKCVCDYDRYTKCYAAGSSGCEECWDDTYWLERLVTAAFFLGVCLLVPAAIWWMSRYKDKKVYAVVPSGGVPVGSPMDFATPYLRHALGFVGITDVEIIGAQGADRGNDEALDNARARIAELIHLAPRAA